MDNFLKELFIDEVIGCLGTDGGSGGGDISGAYDTDGDGVIDNAAQLGGVSADQYALKTDVGGSEAAVTDDGDGNITIS